jgi:leucine-rich repeat transmembrane neuronal protein 1/2
MDPHLRPPATLWSGTLRHGYVGCLRELYLNGAPIDLVQHARQQDVGKNMLKVTYSVE